MPKKLGLALADRQTRTRVAREGGKARAKMLREGMAFSNEDFNGLPERKKKQKEQSFKDMVKKPTKIKLGSSHLGNGIIFWDSNREEHGDFKQVAHIMPNRAIRWDDKKILKSEFKMEKEKIENFAKTADPNISQTQESKVFDKRPK